MKQAARLDLTTYEDPEFYDRLERARVQATDRLAMIQQMGRLFLQVLTTLIWGAQLVYYSPWLMLLLVLGVAAAFLRRDPFRLSGLREEFPADAHQAHHGLPAHGGRQQGSGQGAEAF